MPRRLRGAFGAARARLREKPLRAPRKASGAMQWATYRVARARLREGPFSSLRRRPAPWPIAADALAAGKARLLERCRPQLLGSWGPPQEIHMPRAASHALRIVGLDFVGASRCGRSISTPVHAPPAVATDAAKHCQHTGFALGPRLPIPAQHWDRALATVDLLGMLRGDMEQAPSAPIAAAVHLQLVARRLRLPHGCSARLPGKSYSSGRVACLLAARRAGPQPRQPTIDSTNRALRPPRPWRPEVVHPFRGHIVLLHCRPHQFARRPSAGLHLQKVTGLATKMGLRSCCTWLLLLLLLLPLGPFRPDPPG